MIKLKAKHLDLDSDFSHYNERHRLACERLQTKASELLASDRGRPSRGLRTGYENKHPDVLLNAAAIALGPDGEKWLDSGIYACEKCGRLYHGDYSTNSDPYHDYCGGDTCQPERSHRKYD